MQLVDQLRAEHVLIEEVLGAFRGWAASDAADGGDGAGVTCGGLEREWWTDAEWETFGERQG